MQSEKPASWGGKRSRAGRPKGTSITVSARIPNEVADWLRNTAQERDQSMSSRIADVLYKSYVTARSRASQSH